jgi:hypothetical protein
MRSIEQRIERWLELYAGERKHVVEVVNTDGLPDRPFPTWDNFTERGDWALRNYEIMCEQMLWLDTDRIPYLDVYTGTEIFAEAFGCGTYQPDGSMPHARYLVHSAEEARRIRAPKLEHTTLMRLFDIADRLRDEAGTEAIFKIPDIQSSMGIAALIWDKTDFVTSLLLDPETVHGLAAEVTKLLIEFFGEWTRRYGKAFISHYPEYYMPDGITLSEDDVGIVDADIFNTFYRPEINKLRNRFGPLGIHCCADARHQWENFASLEDLRLINLRIENVEMELESYSVFQDRCVHMNQRVPDRRPEEWKYFYPGNARTVIRIGADTRDEALRLSEVLMDV